MLELSLRRFDAKELSEKALGVIKRWYESKGVPPGLLNSLMKSPSILTEIRRRWVPEASGDVIEIGVGSGLNLPFYQSGARVFAVDPSRRSKCLRARSLSRAGPSSISVLNRVSQFQPMTFAIRFSGDHLDDVHTPESTECADGDQASAQTRWARLLC